MATVKKSLTVNELAEKIKMLTQKKTKDSPQGPTSKQIIAELREHYTFSKDKWTAARKLVAIPKAIPIKPTKKPAKVACTAACATEKAIRECFDVLDKERMSADAFVAALFAFSKTHPDTISSIDVCPMSHPTLFAALDRAVEAGLLKEFHGYALGDAYSKKNAPKKANKK